MGINWDPCSNAEFAPPERDAVVVETERRVEAQSTQIARSLNIDRRRFVASLSGTALALLTLDACSKEKHAAERAVDPTLPAQPGGTFAVPSTAVTEPDVATTVLSGSEFIFDVQTHLLPYDLTRPSSNFGTNFPQVNCGESDSRACFDLDHYLDLIFLQSDTNAIVLSRCRSMASTIRSPPKRWPRRVASPNNSAATSACTCKHRQRPTSVRRKPRST